MTLEDQQELAFLEAEERSGRILTGGQRGRLWDLRRAEILDAIQSKMHPVSPVIASMEVR